MTGSFEQTASFILIKFYYILFVRENVEINSVDRKLKQMVFNRSSIKINSVLFGIRRLGPDRFLVKFRLKQTRTNFRITRALIFRLTISRS